MSNNYGNVYKIGIFGQSHSPAVGVVIDGLPAGAEIDTSALQRFLDRRAPGRNSWSSARKEGDVPEFLSGVLPLEVPGQNSHGKEDTEGSGLGSHEKAEAEVSGLGSHEKAESDGSMQNCPGIAEVEGSGLGSHEKAEADGFRQSSPEKPEADGFGQCSPEKADAEGRHSSAPASSEILVCTGTAVTAVIRNSDAKSRDYEALRYTPRPGHADWPAYVKYGENRDFAGGGHFSGRMTAPLCIAGGIALQQMEKQGIRIISRIAAIGGLQDEGELLGSTAGKAFPTVSDAAGDAMKAAIEAARQEGDSLGGIIECRITGLPAGLGDHMFDGIENRIAKAVFGIPAVKGIEFGSGFAAASMKGSENNDPIIARDGRITCSTNNAGGILGGLTTGLPVTFRGAVKPTPSIAKAQKTVDLRTLEEKELVISGRHDPCIVPRAVPAVEAAAAVAIYDALLESRAAAEGING